jgi:hypothetical protein
MTPTKDILQTFATPPAFWTPEHIGLQTAWQEHAPFAFWLMDVLRPKNFVELGAHGGFSYFVFCQAVKRLRLKTRCYAVDTWQGDEHAGFYGHEIFQSVKKHNAKNYAGFSTLIRSTFEEALGDFKNGTVDLLHVDGRHFYDDVKYDYETWKTKLTGNAVVLFHDCAVRDRGFGVFKLWKELTKNHPHFEFLHSSGLGVLGVGKRFPPQLQALFKASKNKVATQLIRNTYERLGLAISASFTSEQQAKEIAMLRHEITLRYADSFALRREIGARAAETTAKACAMTVRSVETAIRQVRKA